MVFYDSSFAVIVLQFEQLSYMFSESNSSDALVYIEIYSKF